MSLFNVSGWAFVSLGMDALFGGDVLHPLAAQLTSPMHWAAWRVKWWCCSGGRRVDFLIWKGFGFCFMDPDPPKSPRGFKDQVEGLFRLSKKHTHASNSLQHCFFLNPLSLFSGYPSVFFGHDAWFMWRLLCKPFPVAGFLLAISSSGLVVHFEELIGAESFSQRYCIPSRIFRDLQTVVHDDACHFCLSWPHLELVSINYFFPYFHCGGGQLVLEGGFFHDAKILKKSWDVFKIL